MIPQRVHVLERLPRSVNGKFDRPQLRRTVVA
jgi:acyl-CoA synthetase (AMP-forming)/AMP-acid ligase II